MAKTFVAKVRSVRRDSLAQDHSGNFSRFVRAEASEKSLLPNAHPLFPRVTPGISRFNVEILYVEAVCPTFTSGNICELQYDMNSYSLS